MSPKKQLGEFSELPDVLQKSMAISAAFSDQEFCLTNLPKLRKFMLSPVWKLGNVFISTGIVLKQQINNTETNIFVCSLRLLAKMFSRLGFLLTRGSFTFVKKLLRSQIFNGFYKRPFLNALWEYLEVDIKQLCFSYIESAPVHPALGPIYKSSDLSVETAVVVGIDLVPSLNQLYFIEANFNIGYSPERLRLYAGNDPLGYNIVKYAVDKKYKNIVVYGRSVVGQVFDKETALTWERIAVNCGCSLRVIDYQFSGLSSSRDKSIEILPPNKERTLNVLLRAPVSASLSKLISEKGYLEELIENRNKNCSVENYIYIPKNLSANNNKLKLKKDKIFPNIIVKHRRKDRGEGIEIFNTEKIPKNYSVRDYLISEFVKPDYIISYCEKRKDQYVYKYRSQILLTTNGPIYLGAHRIRSVNRIPDDLQKGKISDINPYIANHSLGAVYEKNSKEEDESCKKVSVRIGTIITDFISKKYVIHT